MCHVVVQMLFWTKITSVFIIVISCASFRILGIEGRAIMVEPPHRSSLWRFNYSNALVNLKDDNLNCGGYDKLKRNFLSESMGGANVKVGGTSDWSIDRSLAPITTISGDATDLDRKFHFDIKRDYFAKLMWQWRVHGGRCGVCGDRFNGSQDNADNGKFATGIIVRRYRDGHYINVTFEVSNNYLGYVEFKLCPRNSTTEILDQSCFNKYPLYIDESHGTRYYVGSRGGIYDIHIRLPGGLVCKHCVLQWKYKTGYRYNGDDTCKCLGCGSQEQYVNCADIEIYPRVSLNQTGRQRINTRGHDIDHHGNLVHHFTDNVLIQPTRTMLFDTTIIGSMQFLAPPLVTMTISSNQSINTSFNRNPAINGSPVSDLSPSYSSVQTLKIIEPTPTIMTPSVDVTPAVFTQRSISSDRIKQEIIKMIGREIRKDTTPTNGVKVFFTVPAVQNGAMTRPPLVAEPTRRFNFLQTDVPNTQFVSVSSILDRFYPNYITPFLFSLTKPRRRSRIRGTRSCDVTSDEFRCVARGIYNQSPGISKWCERNCKAQNCVSFMCECFCEDKRRVRTSNCHAINKFKGVEGMDLWCTANCKVGYCPPNTCSVEDCLKPDTSSNGEP